MALLTSIGAGQHRAHSVLVPLPGPLVEALVFAAGTEYVPQRMARLGSLLAGASLLQLMVARDAHADASWTRSIWLAPSYPILLSDAFSPSSRHGLGAGVTYDFHVTPRLDIGLTLAYRLYPGDRSTQQLGYGTILRHFFSAAWASDDGVYPYLDYGLLLQQTWIEGRSGSAISHDTRPGAGAVLRRGGVPVVVGPAGHF